MITSVYELPATETSKPFCDAEGHCGIRKYGYTEKEYFFNGTANVYRTDEQGDAAVEFPDVHYVNRMIIRMPADPAAFNGHVLVEILNATAHYDIERMWIVSHEYFMRHGVIYVGLTSKPDVFDALQNYDHERYDRLSWPNPRPESERIIPENIAGRISFGRPDQECGLFWDMLSDIAVLLREDSKKNPLSDYKPKYVSLTGWSQSCGYITRYLNSFAYRDENRSIPYYDGYFAAGGVYSFSVPLNQNEYYEQKKSWSFTRRVEQPYVMVQTESENGSLGAMDVPRNNSDIPGLACRIYEIPGSTHDYKYAMNDYYANDGKIEGVNYPSRYQALEEKPNSFPCKYPMNAAYDHFFRWIETGTAPARPPRFMRDPKGDNMVDALGNALGGIRTVFVDLPTRRYIPWTHWPRNGDYFVNCIYGHEEMFSPAMLKEMYGSLDQYRERAKQLIRMHVIAGYVLKEEAEQILNDAADMAAEAGLE